VEVLFMAEYLEYIIISLAVLSVLIVALLAILLLKVQYLRQYFNSRKFKLSMKLEVDPSTHLDKFVFYIYNNNLNDARVNDVGIAYDQESITFFKQLEHKLAVEPGERVIISTRDSISLDIDIREMYELIVSRNKGVYRLKKVRLYVVDSSGFDTKVKAKDLVKTLKRMLKADRKVIREAKCTLRKLKFKAFFDFKKNHVDTIENERRAAYDVLSSMGVSLEAKKLKMNKTLTPKVEKNEEIVEDTLEVTEDVVLPEEKEVADVESHDEIDVNLEE
jgi:hypothetical protein